MGTINVSGTIALFFANFIGKVFGAIYRLPLSNILGAEGMGLYQMAFPTYSFLLSFITGGISIGLTRKIAEYRAKNNNQGIYKTYVMGKNVSLFFGIIFFIALLALSYPLATLQGNSRAFSGYIGIALGFLFAVLLGAFRGYYQGYGNFVPTAISQLLEQVIKLVFGLVFAYVFIGINLSLGVFGALLGISISEFLTFIYFLIVNKKHIKRQKIKIYKGEYRAFLKEILPISLTYIILPLSMLIDSFLVINLLKWSGFSSGVATSLYGVETGMILPLINMPNVLISALALASIPHLSYKISKGENIKKEITDIFKITLYFILPCCIGILLLSRPILNIIFPTLTGRLLAVGIQLLKFSVIEMFFLCFVTISNSVLQALGKAKSSAGSMLIGITIKLVLMCILTSIPSINILGLVIASLCGYFAVAMINLNSIKNTVNFRLFVRQLICPIFAVLIMAFFVLMCFKILNRINFLSLCLIVGGAVVIYFVILGICGEFKLKEIKKYLRFRQK